MPTPIRSRRHLAHVVAGLLMLTVACGPAAARELIYAPEPAADAAFDAGAGAALRQAPIADITNPRWPVDRRVGKVGGGELSKMSASAMAAALRAAWTRHPVGGAIGGTVAVDEIRPSDWSATASANLTKALASLGPDASRVFLYVSPAVVERVGRTDPRSPLGGEIAPIFAMLAAGGTAYLEMYRGDLSPYPAREMAVHPTRWLARWPAGRTGNLRLLIGPGGSTGQAEIWSRIRATPAGRTLLANGAAYYAPAGKGTAADGAAWAQQLTRFLAAPGESPAGGDYPVPTGGDVAITPPKGTLRPGGALTLTTNRAGSAVVRLISASGKVRIIKGSLKVGPGGVATITLPDDVRSGRYRVVVSFRGEGLSDQVSIPVTIRRAEAATGTPGKVPPGFRTRLLEGQRVAQDAVRLLNAIDAWLNAGIATGDLAPGGFGGVFQRTGAAPALAAGLHMASGAPPVAAEPVAARPIVPAASRGRSGAVRVTPEQLLINQRISQAAVMRANALDARLAAGLTGGDLLEGAITPGKLAGGVRVVVTAADARPAASVSTPGAITRRSARGLRVTSAQLSINLRISKAALARARALATRLTSGLTEEDFRAGSVVAANLASATRAMSEGARCSSASSTSATSDIHSASRWPGVSGRSARASSSRNRACDQVPSANAARACPRRRDATATATSRSQVAGTVMSEGRRPGAVRCVPMSPHRRAGSAPRAGFGAGGPRR